MKRSVRLATFFLLVGLGLALAYYHWSAPLVSARRFDLLSTWGLGRHLAEKYPGSHVLVLSNPFTTKGKANKAIRRQEENRIEGLQQGFGAAAAAFVVVYPELKPGALENPPAFVSDPETTTPLSYLMETNAVELLLAQHPEADLIISLVGIPETLPLDPLWTSADGPRFAFLLPDLRLLGGVDGVRYSFRDGRLAGFVLNHPGQANAGDQVTGVSLETFNRYFVWVDPDSFEDFLGEWGRLLDQ